MTEIVKELKKEEEKLEKTLKKFKINAWMIASIVLLVALVVVVAFSGNMGGMSKNAAGEKLVSFLNANVVQGGGVTLKDVQSKGNLYEVNVMYKGEEIPVYITKDGKYFIQGATEIAAATGQATADSSASTPADVPKTDKPKVEAFVFSYCPYGLQFEKALSPVYDLLKNKADINVVYIGAMHGEYEKVESLRQLCILKNYGKDTLWNYLNKFTADTAIGNCRGNDSCLAPLLSNIYSQVGVDKSKIESCMAADAEALYNADTAEAQSLGISGSPTFVINGVEVQVGRTPAAIEAAICNAFTTAPGECSQNLSSSAASAGFGASAGSSSGASCG